MPLSKEIISLAVIGSLASSKDVPLGSWRAQADENSAVSLFEGIKNVIGERATFSPGYTLTSGRRTFIHELTIVKGDKSQFKAAIGLAKKSEVVVLALGEDCWQTGEGRSQTAIGLKGDQLDLFYELLKVNKNIVVILMNGRALAIPEVEAQAMSILETWHLGSEAGNAIADVLFGDINPSGKLPVSFPKNVGQVPIYYNRKNTGRPVTNDFDAGLVFWSHYTDSPNEPLYPFGYGLSYTSFDIADPEISATSMNEGGQLTLAVAIKNTGKYAGTEVIQLYIRDHTASVTRPIKELKAFKLVALEAGETKTATFTIDEQMLSFYGKDLTFGAESGKFTIMIGSNSRDVKGVNFELL